MKNNLFKIYFLAILGLIFAIAAIAGTDPTNVFSLGDKTNGSNKVFRAKTGSGDRDMRYNTTTGKWEFSNDGSQFKEFGSGSGAGGGGVVLNLNGGFEEGTASWTASGGTFTTTTTAANVGFGATAGSWDASAASQTLSSDLVTIPAGLYGKVCSLSWYYKGGDANLKAQVYDGTNVIAESSAFTAQTSYSAKQVIYFTCPSSGQMRARFIASANAAIVYLDDVKIGQENLVSVGTNGFVASGYIATTASCNWARSSSSVGAFSTVAACPGPTVEASSGIATLSTADTDLPRFTMQNLPKGTYAVTISGTVISSGTGYLLAQIHDGTTTRGNATFTSTTAAYTTAIPFSVRSVFSYGTDQASVSYELYAAAASADFTLQNSTGTTYAATSFVIEKIDGPTTESFVSVDKTGWRIDANIGGANAQLGTSTVSSYTEITDGGLDIVAASGSAAVEIPCSGTNPSSGLTCSAGSESLGVAFTPPTAGVYEACFQFSHGTIIPASGTIISTFQVVKTPNNAQTVLEEGGARLTSHWNEDSNTNNAKPINICGTFTLADTSKATLRLMFEQQVTTATASYVIADRDAAQGQQDVKVTVRRRVEYADSVKFTNLATTTIATGIKINTAKITTSGSGASCVVDSESGDWLGATTPHATGQCSIVINAAVFAQTPHCFCDTYTNNAEDCNITDATALSSTLVRLNRFSTTSGSNADGSMHIQCVGY